MSLLQSSLLILGALFLTLISLQENSFIASQDCQWNYDRDSDHGPQEWHNLCEGAWKQCSSVEQPLQSPINLVSDDLNENNNGSRFSSEPYSDLTIHYENMEEMKMVRPDDAPLTMKLAYDNGEFLAGNVKVSSKNIYFHTPSEHQLDGRPYDMEIQIEHQNDDGELVMLAFLVDGNSGRKSDWLQELIDAGIPSLETARTIETSPKFILPMDRSYFWYEGSRTTPPCEKAKWFIFRRPVEASPSQVQHFSSALQQSNRPLQAFTQHEVFWFDRTHSPYSWIIVLIVVFFSVFIFTGFLVGCIYTVVRNKMHAESTFEEKSSLAEGATAYGSHA